MGFAQLRAAAPYDPAAFRAFWTIYGMLCRPEDIYTNPAVVAGTREVIHRHGTGAPMAQPTREELLAALAS